MKAGRPSYSFTVSVHDDKDADGNPDTTVDATQNVTITVTNENETIDLQGSHAVDYAENGTGDVAQYTATDPENSTITWDLAGEDESLFLISSSGVLTFVSSPDFEAPGDQGPDNKYQVAIEAFDLICDPCNSRGHGHRHGRERTPDVPHSKPPPARLPKTPQLASLSAYPVAAADPDAMTR